MAKQSRYTPAIMEIQALLKLDASLSQKIRVDSSQALIKKIAAFLAHSGDSWFWAAGLGLVYLFSSGEWRRASALMLGAVVGLAVLVLGIKFLIRRRRPEGDWGAIYRNTDPHSFPSGHAARAFMLAVMALGLAPAWFGWLLVIWAPLVCLARVAMGLHYISDVLAGMLLGIMVGLAVVALAPSIIALFPFLF